MRTARIMMLGLALAAGGTALVIMANAPKPITVSQVINPPDPASDEILVASVDLPQGRALSDTDVTWQKWPSANVQPGMITRKQGEAANDLRGAYVRQPIAAGDPIRRERLLRTGRASGYLAATLQPGLRAIAIPIDAQGLSTAGGFIQPNDRVDVVKISRDDEGRGLDLHHVHTLLFNVRVLAIGANITERAPNATTATLEVTADQGEMLILAQRTSQLTLALRAQADQDLPTTGGLEREGITTIIRSGFVQGVR